MRRQIPEPHSLAPDAIMKGAQSDTVLEAANMAQMVGVLQQLGLLATYSHELFTDLTIEAEGSLTRINQLKGRLGRVTERLARVDDALAAAGESELANICAANPGGAAWLKCPLGSGQLRCVRLFGVRLVALGSSVLPGEWGGGGVNHASGRPAAASRTRAAVPQVADSAALAHLPASNTSRRKPQPHLLTPPPPPPSSQRC